MQLWEKAFPNFPDMAYRDAGLPVHWALGWCGLCWSCSLGYVWLFPPEERGSESGPGGHRSTSLDVQQGRGLCVMILQLMQALLNRWIITVLLFTLWKANRQKSRLPIKKWCEEQFLLAFAKWDLLKWLQCIVCVCLKGQERERQTGSVRVNHPLV